jgi:hypothetical protein
LRESGRAEARSALSSIVDLEDLEGVRQAIRERAIDYPVVVDRTTR